MHGIQRSLHVFPLHPHRHTLHVAKPGSTLAPSSRVSQVGQCDGWMLEAWSVLSRTCESVRGNFSARIRNGRVTPTAPKKTEPSLSSALRCVPNLTSHRSMSDLDGLQSWTACLRYHHIIVVHQDASNGQRSGRLLSRGQDRGQVQAPSSLYRLCA